MTRLSISVLMALFLVSTLALAVERVVLSEGIMCTIVGYNEAAETLLTNICNQYPTRMVVLKYHYLDGMANNETTQREVWYSGGVLPCLFTDGIHAGWPINPNWEDSLLFHLTIESPLEFTISGEYDAQSRTGTIEVEVYVEGRPRPGADYRIVYVMAEDSVLDGITIYYEVVRDMIPDPNATPIMFVHGENFTFSTDFTINQYWNPDHCYMGVFIQDFRSHAVLQAGKVNIIDLSPPPAPAVGASADSLDFGEVEVGESVQLPLTIYSVGELPLVIYQIHANNLSFTTNWDPADSLLAPGDSLEISVAFSPIAVMEFHRTLLIESNADLVNVGLNGIGTPASAVNPNPSTVIPKTFALNAPYPNPFNPVTTISFDMPFQNHISINICNILGEQVAVLLNGNSSPGNNQIQWDAKDFPSGIYFCRMQAGGFQQVQKLLVLK